MAGKQLVDQFGHALVGPTITSTYKPVDMRYFTAVRDLPPLSLSTIEVMRKDSMVKLCLGILAAPLFKMELAYKEGDDWKPGVLAESPIVAEFVQRQFNTIWKWASHLCSAQVYGWCAAEVVLKYGDSDLIEVDSLVPRHARDVKALVQNGEVMGVQFERLNGGLNGIEKVGFPRCIWHIHAPQPGMFYGTSVLEGAYSPWWDKWMRGGAYDVRRLFMFKDAYGGMDMTYPVKDYDMGNGVVLHAKDIARQVVEQSQSGSVTTRPYDPDANGKNQWELERTSMPGNPQHILEYPDKCDREIQHGMGINDDVITADSSGSWNGKGLAMFALMITRDEWGALMLSDVVCQVIRQLVDINFGPDTYFEATHKPFAEQLKDQLGDSPQQQGGGLMPGRFGGQMGGNTPFGQDDEDGADLEPEQALRMSYAAIGRGVVEARKFVDGATRLANDGSSRWITIGGSKNADGSRDGGFPVMIDKDGNITRSGGPQGVLGKKIGDLSKGDFSSDYKELEAEKKPAAKKLSPAQHKWNATVRAKAEEWGITPAAYQEIADQIWKERQQAHIDREAAKSYARELTGLSKGDIDRLENQGFDHSSGKHAKTKKLDIWGQEIARQSGLWNADDDSIDHGEKLWELLKEGKQSLPARGSKEYVEAIDEFLADQMREFDFADNGEPSEVDEDWLAKFSLVTRMSLLGAIRKRAKW